LTAPRSGRSTLRILLADDHQIVRRGLKQLLDAQSGWIVCAEAASGREAVELALQERPDVAVLDLAMPELNGLEATRRIRKAAPETEILVFTMHDSDELVRELFVAGARGYLLKFEAADQLIAAIRNLADHKPFFSPRISEVVFQRFLQGGSGSVEGGSGSLGPTGMQRLTSREREIVQLLAEGKSNKDIARLLELSVKTVETHRAAIMRKLELGSIADLVRFAIRNQIVQP
jgi:DNA-binding NarL/FixJ family response regulator